MIKVIVAIKRRVGTTPEEFQAHWRTQHANKVKSAACTKRYLRKYVQCHTLLEDYANGAQPAYDGVTELWFDSVTDNAAFFSDPEYLADIKPDESEFADMTLTVAFQTTEETVI